MPSNTRRTQAVRAAAVLSLALALAGCKGPDAPSAAPAGSSRPTPAGTPKAVGGSCGAYTAGRNGVTQTYCDGTADIEVSLGGQKYELKNGSCQLLKDQMLINAGVITGPAFTGRQPDNFGVNLSPHAGPFSVTVVGMRLGGKQYTGEISGTIAAGLKGGAFTGRTMSTMEAISGTFTC